MKHKIFILQKADIVNDCDAHGQQILDGVLQTRVVNAAENVFEAFVGA